MLFFDFLFGFDVLHVVGSGEDLVDLFNTFVDVILDGRECRNYRWGTKAVSYQRKMSQVTLDLTVQYVARSSIA